jgi:hypothetical protein
MPTTSPLFDINQLNPEQRKNFDAVYNELKSKHRSYLQYKNDLQLKKKFDIDEEENEWCYELHRYLRARKWNVSHTIKSILEMIDWRIDNHVDLILEDQSAILRMNLLEKLIPGANHGYTKTDRPLYIEKSGLIPVDKLLNQFKSEDVIQYHIYWFEFNCQRARERSRQVGKHIENFTIIYDLNGLTLAARKTLHLLKQCFYIDNNYYPERLGQMFVVNPPMIFPTIWNIVKPWLDPVTQTKVFVIRKGPETATTLLQHINSDQLPSEYGGTCHTCSTSPDCIPINDSTTNISDDKSEEQ